MKYFYHFFIAGITVAIIAQIALFAAYQLRKIKFSDPVKLANFNFWGKGIELSVIGGFGLLSLWHGFSGNGNLYVSILVAAVIINFIFLKFREELMENELAESEEAVT